MCVNLTNIKVYLIVAFYILFIPIFTWNNWFWDQYNLRFIKEFKYRFLGYRQLQYVILVLFNIWKVKWLDDLLKSHQIKPGAF